ncbi:MAG: hypothetical protein K2N74_06395, partial [Clostridiales bacterium]|nr:hypothetical protein [Clostridiales bacterium]
MPKCENCGKEFNGNFCPMCGTKAEPVKGNTFKNETRIDVDFSIRASENVLGKKLKVLMLIGALALILIGAVWLTLELVLPSQWEPELFPPILFFALGLFVGIFALCLKPLVRYFTLKNLLGKESVNTYTFTEEGYEIFTKMSDGTESKATGNYGGFVEAKEYADMWLLYINKATVFSVDKNGMTEGTAEELSAWLVSKMGERYKVCY